jgi:hypothetical protein
MVRNGYDWDGVAELQQINDLDAVSAATPPPNQSYRVTYEIADALADGDYVVWVEVNQEGDFNETYHSAFFPDALNPTYGIDFLGQPSVVWRAPVQIGRGINSGFAIDYVAYGSFDGSDGDLRAPDTTITTGLPGSGAERLQPLPDGSRVRATFDPNAFCSSQAVSDLHVTATDANALTLAFTAPAAGEYEARYASSAATIEDDAAFMAAAPAALLRATTAGESLTFNIEQLQPSTPYAIAVRARCNTAVLMSLVAMTARIASPELDECFIATAAFGSKDDRHVAKLRVFRDQILRKNALGRAAISIYYEISPPIADLIREHEILRAFVRAMITPIANAVAE